MRYHGVCYLQMTLFLLMRLGRELMTSWSDRDIHWNLEVLELVDRKRNTFIAVSMEGWMRGGEVTLNGRPILKVEKFKYLGSII